MNVYVAPPAIYHRVYQPRVHLRWGFHHRPVFYGSYGAYPTYSQPGYSQPYPSYGDDFGMHVRSELAQLESAVRERVAEGQLDGNALTAMESARDDIQRDLSDLSQKGYFTDADRAHVEQDVQALRARFGC